MAHLESGQGCFSKEVHFKFIKSLLLNLSNYYVRRNSSTIIDRSKYTFLVICDGLISYFRIEGRIFCRLLLGLERKLDNYNVIHYFHRVTKNISFAANFQSWRWSYIQYFLIISAASCISWRTRHLYLHVPVLYCLIPSSSNWGIIVELVVRVWHMLYMRCGDIFVGSWFAVTVDINIQLTIIFLNWSGLKIRLNVWNLSLYHVRQPLIEGNNWIGCFSQIESNNLIEMM